MTPSELNKITSAVAKAAADVLARDENESLSAEDVAQDIAEAMTETMISSYEAVQAKSYNLVVLGHFRLEDDQSYAAAVGPLSTRAPQRARAMGERFAWDYKTRRGTGKFVLVPLVRDVSSAWDAVRKEATPPREVREAFEEAQGLPYYATGDPYVRGGTCICGIKSVREGLFVCPQHPEGRDGDQQGPP